MINRCSNWPCWAVLLVLQRYKIIMFDCLSLEKKQKKTPQCLPYDHHCRPVSRIIFVLNNVIVIIESHSVSKTQSSATQHSSCQGVFSAVAFNRSKHRRLRAAQACFRILPFLLCDVIFIIIIVWSTFSTKPLVTLSNFHRIKTKPFSRAIASSKHCKYIIKSFFAKPWSMLSLWWWLYYMMTIISRYVATSCYLFSFCRSSAPTQTDKVPFIHFRHHHHCTVITTLVNTLVSS